MVLLEMRRKLSNFDFLSNSEQSIHMPTNNVPQVAVNDIGSAEDFLAAVDETITVSYTHLTLPTILRV